MSFRTWLTIITIVLLAIVVIVAWPEIMRAFALVERVNGWILLLLIPVQVFSYYATGGMIFSYLRSKGELKDMSQWRMTRIAFELNFVNHILPSGGAAGFSYMGWLLSKFGVTVGRATMAQIVRFVMTFLSFVLILLVSVGFLIVDHQINRWVILLSAGLVVLCIVGITLAIYVIGSKRQLEKFATWLTVKVNAVVRFVTRGRKRTAVKEAVLSKFFNELHDDYIEIRRDKKILLRPFMWAVLANIADVLLLFIAFWSLGYIVSFATLFVAFGVASVGGAVASTPGGAGVYEAIFIAFLATSNIPADVAIAGTLLARVTLVLGTILFGYLFYQMTILKYGKTPA